MEPVFSCESMFLDVWIDPSFLCVCKNSQNAPRKLSYKFISKCLVNEIKFAQLHHLCSQLFLVFPVDYRVYFSWLLYDVLEEFACQLLPPTNLLVPLLKIHLQSLKSRLVAWSFKITVSCNWNILKNGGFVCLSWSY